MRFHKLAALVVLGASTAWILTGEFSSVGSAQSENQPPVSAPEGAPVSDQRVVRTVGVVTPPRRDHARAIRISGTTEANRRSALAARTAGIVAELPVRQGSSVSAGDIVMRLDSEDKRSAVEMATAVLAQRQAELNAAERLATTGNVARLQLDGARAALATAQAQLDSANAELERYVLRAPFDGLVDRVSVEEGSAIAQSAQVAIVLDLDPILAVGQVNERDLESLRIGEASEIRLVNGAVAQGTLRYVSRDASPQTRTYGIEVSVPNPDRSFPAGMTTEITLRSDPVDAVFLPRSVVTLSGAGDLGIRIVGPDNKVGFVPIDLIDDTPTGLVLGGVPKDARIIVAGQDLVAEGDTVNPVEADAATVRRLIGEATGTTN
ncbi:efflux RND transporter periplasmic adaptor subunit [Aquibium carbonis]